MHVARVRDGRVARGYRETPGSRGRSLVPRGSHETSSQGDPVLAIVVILVLLLVRSGAAMGEARRSVMHHRRWTRCSRGTPEQYDMDNVLLAPEEGRRTSPQRHRSGEMASRRWSATTRWSAACYPGTWAGPDEAMRDAGQRARLRGRERHRHGRRPQRGPQFAALIDAEGLSQARRLPARRQYPDGKVVVNVGEQGLSGRVDGRLELGLLGPHGQQEEDRRPHRPWWCRGPARTAAPAATLPHTSRATRGTWSASATRVLRATPGIRATTTAPRSTSRLGGIR